MRAERGWDVRVAGGAGRRGVRRAWPWRAALLPPSDVGVGKEFGTGALYACELPAQRRPILPFILFPAQLTIPAAASTASAGGCRAEI